MPAANLTDLINEPRHTTPTVAADTEPPKPQPSPAHEVPGTPPTLARGPRTPSAHRPSFRTEPESAEHRPTYLRLRRKETRIRPDQEIALTQLRQRLNAQREHPGERLTENSLIRIAIDLLLTQGHTLTGGDETALRAQLDL